jgi:hypothetical protein
MGLVAVHDADRLLAKNMGNIGRRKLPCAVLLKMVVNFRLSCVTASRWRCR